MGTAYVKGMQKGENAATLKHFLGYSATSGGINMAQTVVSPRDLRENFARPFEMAIRDGGAFGIMSSYSEYNGRAVCASKEILSDLLRGDLGFDGVVVSDYASVERLPRVFGMAEDMTSAGEMCLAAGMDMELPARVGFSRELVKDAREGRFDMAYIDRAVERVLTLKYELGLFENPFPRPEEMIAFDNTENNKRSLEAARKAMTLTKNEGLLPLTDHRKKLAVIGPMGNTLRAFFGCYTLAGGLEMAMSGSNAMAGVAPAGGEAKENQKLELHIVDDMLRTIYPEAKTTLEMLKSCFDQVSFVEGCDYVGTEKNDFATAVEAAKNADVVIAALGGRNGWGTYCTNGEGIDTTDIGLPGCQEELLRTVYEANPHIVLVHTDVRPVVSEWIYEHIPAILEAWLPCTYGGVAITETITGENNPGGRLQMDVPRSSSHGPVAHYLSRGTQTSSFRKGAINPRGYINSDMSAQLPFGHGLSYTSFAYDEFTLTMDDRRHVTATVKVTNTGSVAGDEVVQLYGTDKVASIVRPAKELIGFKRVTLQPGESKTVRFTFNLDILSFFDEPGHWILEKGEFAFYLGKNCEEAIASGTVYLDDTYEVDHQKRCLIALADDGGNHESI
ncbi:MAG: glycoside hydrolase family 3 C-terminal domain-containing protein, partial [Blautia sp.]|nr:glycoside hydrolase family 3 C-terminal domain-containing protein [Blautia sp.]